MRILVTGCTFLQVNPQRRVIKKIDVPQSIVETLESLGHEVDWRLVHLGEDLSDYDAALVCLAPITSTNARKGALGALWTLSKHRNLPTAALFDDWQFPAVFSGFRALKRNPAYLHKILWGERFFFSEPEELVTQHTDEIIETAIDLLGPAWERVLPVCPMYRWGDRDKVISKMPDEITSVFALDPSPTIYESVASVTSVAHDGEKERAWIMAALMPHGEWLEKKDVTWPVHLFGSRKLKAERLKTEEDVIAQYAKHWGALSPPYTHAGGGWWRSRFIYSASVGTILVCDKGEGDPIGDAYKVRISHIETASDDELLAIATQQKDELRPWLTSWSDWEHDVNRMFTDAVARHNGRANV